MQRPRETWTSEAIISDALCCPPDVSYHSIEQGWQLSRWRQFVGHYQLPALPSSMYVAHIGGKQQVRMWERGGWSDVCSKPSDATVMPRGMDSRWLVDGELDVVTLSVGAGPHSLAQQDIALRFAYNDPFGIALVRQILTQLYEEETIERNTYIEALFAAFKAHLRHGGGTASTQIPCTLSSPHRLHAVLAKIRECPEADFSLESLAMLAGMKPSHFCRMFRNAMGTTPHQYVIRSKLRMAEDMLRNSRLSIMAIADALGFKTQGHFTRLFRQQVGETPTDFRRRGCTGE